MKRIFAVTVAKEYSWYGKKQNKTFSDLKLCSVIISEYMYNIYYTCIYLYYLLKYIYMYTLKL